ARRGAARTHLLVQGPVPPQLLHRPGAAHRRDRPRRLAARVAALPARRAGLLHPPGPRAPAAAAPAVRAAPLGGVPGRTAQPVGGVGVGGGVVGGGSEGSGRRPAGSMRWTVASGAASLLSGRY